ncbi:MAG: MFS transporter [Caulobacter sp.]|nr:MFS transporter [Caulobacter sp.]
MKNQHLVWSRLGRAPTTALVVVSAANLLNYFDRSIFNLVLEPIRQEFELTNTELGFLAGGFALLFSLSSLPMAWLADRWRRLSVVGGSVAVWSLATAATGFATSFGWLFAARVAVGVGEAGCLPAGTSLIGDHYPPTKRAGAMAIFQGSGLLGSMLGLMIVGVLADRLGWRLALITASLVGLLLAPVVLFLREPPRGRFDSAQSATQSWPNALGVLLRSPVYLLLVAAITWVSLGFTSIGAWGPSFFVRSFDLSLSTVGLLFGLSFGLSAAAGTFIGGYATSRLTARNRRWEFWVPAGAYALAVPLYEAALHVPTATGAFSLVALASFTAFLGYGPTMSLYHVVAPPAVRATAVAIGACTAGLIGAFGGPVAVGLLTDALTPTLGADALRGALSVLMLGFLVPAALYALAGRMAFGGMKAGRPADLEPAAPEPAPLA